ncbi:type III polyketide synthase [Metabacillus sp. RGM 3146]|uniref:type III polyketide synthase n=1 Tax=Metabacillus sp. RGM 3146 TaxID=3401092 RepID=UPI003B99C558
MAYIVSVGTSLPKNEMDQEKTVEFAKEMFQDSFKDINRLLKSFKNGGIKKRQFAESLDWYKETHTFQEKNEQFIYHAVRQGAEAVVNCLSDEEFLSEAVPVEVIDAIFFISSTGIATPSIDARIMNILPFKESTKRIPIWGLGCAGGAAGLSRAFEYCSAYKTAKVLVLAVELCSLTFQKDDVSKSNLIGTSLFADGIACALIAGEEALVSIPTRLKALPKIEASRSSFMKQSEDVMGWDIRDNGLYVIFSRDIPGIISDWLKPNVMLFLNEHNVSLNEITHFMAHPGGKKILDAYEESLGLGAKALLPSKEVLINHGNMSSVTVLYVIREFLHKQSQKCGEKGLIGALGPGFCSEMLLVEWEEPA